MKITVYTCEVGDYDCLLPPMVNDPNIRFVCFTDRPRRHIKGWQLRYLLSPPDVVNPTLINRYHKFFSYKLSLGSDWTIYIDANIRITGQINDLVDQVRNSCAIMACPKHPDFKHRTLEDEIIACVSRRKFTKYEEEVAYRQINSYFYEGMPSNIIRAENNFIIRYDRDKALQQAMNAWWEQLNIYTKRDQLSLPYIIWRYNIPFVLINKNSRTPNSYFYSYSHKRTGLGLIKQQIYYLKKYPFIYKIMYAITHSKIVNRVRDMGLKRNH